MREEVVESSEKSKMHIFRASASHSHPPLLRTTPADVSALWTCIFSPALHFFTGRITATGWIPFRSRR